MADDGPRGRAVQILGLTAGGETLVVNERNLDRIRTHFKEADVTRLSVVSVAGSFRTGKSFMLNLMVKYLAHYDNKALGQGTHWATGRAEPLSGRAFEWKPGVDRHTTGIWMYDTPFVRVVNGTRVGIVLIDTQGLWDGSSGYSLLTSIFGLSSIMSSVQVYNLMRTVEIDKLDQVKWFSGFGASALRQCRDAKDETRVVRDAPAFQSLHLMVRDWVGFSDPGDGNACAEETRHFLREQRKQSEFGRFLGELEKVYLSVECVLLPPPGGECCFDASFDGDLGCVKPEFLQNATAYFHSIFHKPAVKQFNGSPVTPDGLVEMVTTFANVFACSDVPTTLSFAGAMETTVNMCARETAVNCYREAMLRSMSAGALVDNQLQMQHARATKTAIAGFERAATYGDAQCVQAEREKMMVLISVARGEMQLRNEELRRKSLNAYAHYVAVGFGAVVIDKTSDLACDWWLPVCRDVSDMLFRCYTYGFIVMLMLLSWFSVKNGPVHTTQALVELGEAVRLCVGAQVARATGMAYS